MDAGQVVQHGLAVAAAGDGVAQRGAHAGKDGGGQQELEDFVGLAAQGFFGEVVDDIGVGAGKTLHLV